MTFKNFVDVCNDAHGLLPKSHLVQLACAVCVLGSNAYQACSLSLELLCSETEASVGRTDLLDVTVAENDGLPKHVCVKCGGQLGSQKRALKDLVNFLSQAVEHCITSNTKGRTS